MLQDHAPLNLGLGEPSPIMNTRDDVLPGASRATYCISSTNFTNQQTHTSTDIDMGLLKAY